MGEPETFAGRRVAFGLVVLFALADAAPAQAPAEAPARVPIAPPSAPTPYTSFQGAERELFAWPGEHVAFLTRSAELDPQTMTRLLEVFDGVHAFYRAATGRTPAPSKLLDGRLTVAEEAETCGAGCGYLGHTGIELTPDCFGALYEGFRAHGRIDQALPYEFGRNFWLYGDRLEPPKIDRNGQSPSSARARMPFWISLVPS